jgi:hypothetical protein
LGTAPCDELSCHMSPLGRFVVHPRRSEGGVSNEQIALFARCESDFSLQSFLLSIPYGHYVDSALTHLLPKSNIGRAYTTSGKR